ncbi:folate-binding protein [Terrarubrum flagellatum]|uniref:CAF17-like 4Fe-4S cluster assembly/insertion protein YgfZ n=1 Tax=Terrirubrum flagellatum TaxID=2895980 RepID=UPI003144FA0E
MPTAYLSDRGVVRVSGAEARDWLNNLVTCDVAGVKPGLGRLGALLTPQGKILVDFLLTESADGDFLIDAPRALIADFFKRLTMYRLRAKIAIDDLSGSHGVIAAWGESHVDDGVRFADPRAAELGLRVIAERATAEAHPDAQSYHAHRIALGIPEGGKDFAYGDAFPHEADMDQLGGVDFKKGCYVGQEVVSRMQHRGSGGRTRIVPVIYEGGFAPTEGVEAKAGDKVIGATGSQANGRGLAKLRLDRVEDALKAGETLSAGGVPFTLAKPAWATFAFPGEPAT